MKKIILFFLCVFVYVGAYAQNNFSKYLAHFKEAKLPTTIIANDAPKKIIDKNLAWEFALEKTTYTKPEEAFVLPIAFYKVSDDIAVLVTASTTVDTKEATYSLSIQTYNIKKGKLIDQFRAMAGTFSDYLGMVCEIEISNKSVLTFTTKSLASTRKNIFEVNKKGKVKELN